MWLHRATSAELTFQRCLLALYCPGCTGTHAQSITGGRSRKQDKVTINFYELDLHWIDIIYDDSSSCRVSSLIELSSTCLSFTKMFKFDLVLFAWNVLKIVVSSFYWYLSQIGSIVNIVMSIMYNQGWPKTRGNSWSLFITLFYYNIVNNSTSDKRRQYYRIIYTL